MSETSSPPHLVPSSVAGTEEHDLVVPWVESPFFAEELAAREGSLTAWQQQVATELNKNGYAALEQIVPHDLCDRIRSELTAIRDEHPDISDDERVPDAWNLGSEATHELAVLPQIQQVLQAIYERKPVPFQTLSFKRGTEQPAHSDSIHFTSYPPRYMCGVWVALEDIDEDRGPLFYYAGSHKLREMTLDDISVPSDQPLSSRYRAYERMQERLMEAHGWEPSFFLAKKGDALIWSSNVVHGGSAVRRSGSTRWSQVTHYMFEGCMYYQPHSSIVPLGELKLLDVTDLNTMRPVPHVFDGKDVSTIALGNGRSRVVTEPPVSSPAPPATGTRPPLVDAALRTLRQYPWGQSALSALRRARNSLLPPP